MQTKIFYLQGIIGEKVLLEDYARIIQKLVNGEFQAADLDLKKVKGYRVYSVRVNLSDRLLFTKIDLKGKNYFVLLEVIYNHDYQKSRFLKPNVLKHYMELNEAQLTAQIDKEIEEINLSADAFAFLQSQDSFSNYSFSPIEFYKEQFRIRSENQQEAVTQSFPLVIGGSAGSGKTLIAVAFIAQFIEKSCSGNLLYITESKELLMQIQSIWQAKPEAQGLCESKVQFKTYAELMQDYVDKALTTVSQAQFIEWLSKTRYKTWDAKKMYQEMRIIAECSSLADYLQLGKRQTLFTEDRTVLFDICQQYRGYLANNQCIDLSLAVLEIKKQSYACILSDESQDLSHQQLKTLYYLAENGQICYFMDSHQSLFDNKSKRPFLLQLIHQSKAKNASSYFELTCNFRCKPAIVKLANQLICLKNNLTGGIADKLEYPEMEAFQEAEGEEGKVLWLESFTPENLAILNQLKNSTAFAIVTSEKNKAKLRELINTALVFTVEEIKGLEYDFVLVYLPFAEAVFQKANKSFKDNNALTQRKHRAKKGTAQEEYGPPFNKMLTSFTRARHTLFIFQPKTNDLLTLINYLETAIHRSRTQLSTITPDLSTMSQQAWEKEREIQALRGNVEQYEKINEDLDAKKSIKSISITPLQRKPAHSKPHKKRTPVRSSTPQKVEAKPMDEEQRVLNPLLANFNQVNLKNLFLSPGAAEFLFRPIPGLVSVFIHAMCFDIQKCQSLKTFIKKNGSLAAKVIEPALLLALENPVKSVELSKTKLFSTVTGQLDFERNRMAILKDLLPHYSYLQKIALYLDSCNLRFIGDAFDNTYSRCFTLENMRKNIQGIYDLLKQPAFDNKKISRLHRLLQVPDRICFLNMDTFFDDDGKCLLPLTEFDLFEVNSESKVSLFYELSRSFSGTRFLSNLLSPENALTKALTVDRLCSINPVYKLSALSNIVVNSMSGTFIKQLITEDVAAHLAKVLPKNAYFMKSLNEEDGVMILERLLGSPNLLRLMTAEQLIKEGCIFSQLTRTSRGIAVLQQLLDFHGEDFARAISAETLFSDYMENCPWTALNLNQQGREFLQNLKAQGMQYPDDFPGEDATLILGILPFVNQQSKIFSASTCRFFYNNALKSRYEIETDKVQQESKNAVRPQ